MTENEPTRKRPTHLIIDGKRVEVPLATAEEPIGGPRHRGCVLTLAWAPGSTAAILTRVSATLQEHLRREGWSPPEVAEELAEFRTQAAASDYNNLLATCLRWVVLY